MNSIQTKTKAETITKLISHTTIEIHGNDFTFITMGSQTRAGAIIGTKTKVSVSPKTKRPLVVVRHHYIGRRNKSLIGYALGATEFSAIFNFNIRHNIATNQSDGGTVNQTHTGRVTGNNGSIVSHSRFTGKGTTKTGRAVFAHLKASSAGLHDW